MKKVLLTYDTMSGATAEISQLIYEALVKRRLIVHRTPVENVDDLNFYDAVILGSPIRFSRCTPRVKKFIHKHSECLKTLPVAFFFSCVSLIHLENRPLPSIPIYFDPAFDMAPRPRKGINFFAYSHTSFYYLKLFLKLIPNAKPISIGFFGGRLDFRKIRFHERLVMRFAKRLLPEIEEGDRINPDAVYRWSELLYSELERIC